MTKQSATIVKQLQDNRTDAGTSEMKINSNRAQIIRGRMASTQVSQGVRVNLGAACNDILKDFGVSGGHLAFDNETIHRQEECQGVAPRTQVKELDGSTDKPTFAGPGQDVSVRSNNLTVLRVEPGLTFTFER